jgi:membrane protein implicated in regulation of membrane protease activity
MESVMDMQWWHWAVLGLALGLLELATPGGFFIIFFGVGALLVGLLSMIGFAGPLWLQWMLFGVLSVVTLFFFRDPLLRRMRAAERTGLVDSLTADIAVDMRALVRERIAAGDSDTEIRGFFRQRYGDFVLFRPPVDARTWALWGAPLLLLGGGFAAVFALRRRRDEDGEAFEPEESER